MKGKQNSNKHMLLKNKNDSWRSSLLSPPLLPGFEPHRLPVQASQGFLLLRVKMVPFWPVRKPVHTSLRSLHRLSSMCLWTQRAQSPGEGRKSLAHLLGDESQSWSSGNEGQRGNYFPVVIRKRGEEEQKATFPEHTWTNKQDRQSVFYMPQFENYIKCR